MVLPGYVTGEGDAPFRPETFIWVDRDGFVLGTQVFRPGELSANLGAFFHETVRAPAVGRPHVPARVRVASNEHAAALRAVAGPTTEVVCAPTPELETLFSSLAAHVEAGAGEDAAPTYLTAGITPELVASQFRAAARLHRSAPWEVVPTDTTVIAVTIAELEVRDAPLIVIGQNAESYGVLLFPDATALDDYFALAAAAAAGFEAYAIPEHIVLNFERGAELDPARRREIAKHGWEVAEPSAYPWIAAVDKDGVPHPPTKRQVAIVEAVSLALAELIETTPRLRMLLETRHDLEKAFVVETSAGSVRVELHAPMDAEDESGEDDDADQDAREAELVERFSRAPEAAGRGAWTRKLLRYARMFHDAGLEELTADVVEDVVFRVFPNKVTCEPDVVGAVVTELRAFFAFARRELGLEQAAAWSRVLGKDAEAKLRRRLSDPRNFGIAKSFAMAGQKAGFDMTTQEGVAAWLAGSGGALPTTLPETYGLSGGEAPAPSKKATAADRRSKKAKRKAARASKRKNR